jgi:hypothetical protein
MLHVFRSITTPNSSTLQELSHVCLITLEVPIAYTLMFFMTGNQNGQRWRGLLWHVFRFGETYLEIQNFIWKRQVDDRVRMVSYALFIKQGT